MTQNDDTQHPGATWGEPPSYEVARVPEDRDPEDADQPKTLTLRRAQRSARLGKMAALIAGAETLNKAQLAQRLGVSRQTLYEDLRSAEFRSLLCRSIDSNLVLAAREATAVLLEGLAAKNFGTRLKAATAILARIDRALERDKGQIDHEASVRARDAMDEFLRKLRPATTAAE